MLSREGRPWGAQLGRGCCGLSSIAAGLGSIPAASPLRPGKGLLCQAASPLPSLPHEHPGHGDVLQALPWRQLEVRRVQKRWGKMMEEGPGGAVGCCDPSSPWGRPSLRCGCEFRRRWWQGDGDLPGGRQAGGRQRGGRRGGQRGSGQARAEGCALPPGPDVISDKIHHGLAMPSRWRGISCLRILRGQLYCGRPQGAGRLRSCLSREERGWSPAEVFLPTAASPDGYGMSPESLALVGGTPCPPCQASQGSSPLLGAVQISIPGGCCPGASLGTQVFSLLRVRWE